MSEVILVTPKTPPRLWLRALGPGLAGTREHNPDIFTGLRNVPQYLHRVGSRPAVQRGMKVPELQR